MIKFGLSVCWKNQKMAPTNEKKLCTKGTNNLLMELITIRTNGSHELAMHDPRYPIRGIGLHVQFDTCIHYRLLLHFSVSMAFINK